MAVVSLSGAVAFQAADARPGSSDPLEHYSIAKSLMVIYSLVQQSLV